MILELSKKDNVLPHFQNILNIHSTNTLFSCIEQYDPLYAGGYPMSLLFAPRWRSNPLKIKSGYYSDYDIYFSTKEDFENALKSLNDKYNPEHASYTSDALWKIAQTITTNNAVTLIFANEDPVTGNRLQLQLIKKVTNPPKAILQTFDFINCAVGFAPAQEKFYLHKDVFSYHNIKELEILCPWMLDELTDETVNNVIIQVARFKKYCKRWDYTLGSKAFDKLIETYLRYPNLKTEKGIGIISEGGAYDGSTFIALANQNIWQAIGSILRIHPKWPSFKDPHGILTDNAFDIDTNILTTEAAQISNEEQPLTTNTSPTAIAAEDDIPF